MVVPSPVRAVCVTVRALRGLFFLNPGMLNLDSTTIIKSDFV